MASNATRDLITVTALQLRSSSLQPDHWLRSGKDQPLLCTLQIATDVSDEAQVDNLLGNSLNYGTVTKTVEQAVADYPAYAAATSQEGEAELEVVAEYLAKHIIFEANAPNVQLELCRPRALLTAEAIGVSIYRTRADYAKPSPTTTHKPNPAEYTLRHSSINPSEDTLFVRTLRRLIIIGLNPCELVDEQEVICDFEFYPDPMEPLLKNGARAGWQGWRTAVRTLEAHLSASHPLTIEACTTDLAEIITRQVPATGTSPGWNVPRTRVSVAKPVALMFAKHPAVQITRSRADFARALSSTATAAETGLHSVVLGVGTNMGDRVANIEAALKELERLGSQARTKVVDTSFLYESEAMYVTEQAKFLNATVRVETLLEPVALLGLLKEVEAGLGRTKGIRNGPRPIDLDILFYDRQVLETHDSGPDRWLQVPHKSIQEREFVLRPLAE